MKTLLLDQDAWDLVLDAKGNIAVAQSPYAIAQNVATAVRTFKNDCIYDQDKGIPYLEQILGKLPPLSYVKSLIEQEALTQSEVVEANAVFIDFTDRELTGQIQVTDKAGNISEATF